MPIIQKSPYPRYREIGSTDIVSTGAQRLTACDGSPLPADFLTMRGHRQGSISGCHDVVTPGFRRLSAQGEVIVNPFTSVRQYFDGGGTGPIIEYLGCKVPLDKTRRTAEYPSSARHFNVEYQFGEVRNALDGTLVPRTLQLIDRNRLIVLASTACMSKVDTGAAQALVTAAEAKRTLDMLVRPLAALDGYVAKQHRYISAEYQKFLARKRPGVSPGRTKAPGGLRAALSSQYLGWYYGMKPMIADVENLLNAYIREGSTPPRETARASAHDEETRITADPPLTPGGGTKYRHQRTLVEQVSVRAGILYQPTSRSYSKELGLRLSDVPSSLWEATTLSFLVDYYANIGDVIRALEPRIGVEYLGNWITVSQTVTEKIEVIHTIYGSSSHTIARPSTEWAARQVASVERIPIANRYSNVGFAVKNGSDNLQRNVAIAALISQRVKAIGAVYGAFALATM